MSGIEKSTSRSAPRTQVTTKPKEPTPAELKKQAAAEKKAKKEESANALAARKDAFDASKSMPELVKNYTGDKSKDIGSLVGGKGDSSVNRDGSVSTTNTKGQTTQTLTTDSSLGTKKLKFESEKKAANGNVTKHSFEAQKDAFGRSTATQKRETQVKLGDTTQTNSRTTGTDMLGGQTVTTSRASATTENDRTTTLGRTKTEGPLGANKTTVEKKIETKHSETSTSTSSTKRSNGTETKIAGTTETKQGKFSVNNTVDRERVKSTEVSKEREFKLKDPLKNTGLGGPDKLNKAQKTADVLANSGLKQTVQGEKWDTAKLKELEDDNVSFAGVKKGTQGDSSVSYGADGLEAKYSRGASAGVYAQKNGKVEGENGTASYKLGARLDARANVDSSVKVNSNGVEGKFGAKASLTAETSANGRLQSKPFTIAGVETNASVDATVRLKAELSAEANVDVKLQRNPPVAVINGKVGASAVVKAEAEITVGAGPFSVTANGYGSAGAEATASGTFGYENGKIKFGFSAGAAVKVGLGGGIKGEIDLKQSAEMLKNGGEAVLKKGKEALDADGDGKLDLKDVAKRGEQIATAVLAPQAAVIRKAAKVAEPVKKAFVKAANTTYRATTRAVAAGRQTVVNTGRAIVNTAQRTYTAVKNTGQAVVQTVVQTAQTVRTTLNNAASTAGSYLSAGANYLSSFWK